MAKLYAPCQPGRISTSAARQIRKPRIGMHARDEKPRRQAFRQQAKAGLHAFRPTGQHHNGVCRCTIYRRFLCGTQEPGEAA